MSKIVSTALKTRGKEAYKPLTQKECDFITQCYKLGMSARSVAPLVPCSCNTLWKVYKRLRAGEVVTPYKGRPRRTQKGIAWRRSRQLARIYIQHWERKKSDKPLVNPNRFYHSNFEPV